MDSIYDRYGDNDFWERVISEFYTSTASDKVLFHYFKGKDNTKIREMHLRLLCSAFQRGGQHFPFSVRKIHKSLEITDDVFERYIEIYEDKLRENGINDRDIEIIIEIMYSFKLDIVKN